jgi:hypothetical protein
MFHDLEMLFGFLALMIVIVAPIAILMFIGRSMTGGRPSDGLLDITGNNTNVPRPTGGLFERAFGYLVEKWKSN